MGMQEIVNIILFILLVYMFCQIEVLPFLSNKERYIVVLGTTGAVLLNICLFVAMPQLVPTQLSLFTQTLPSLVICFLSARHKDMRAIFVFCSLDVIAFMLLLIANAVAVLLHFGSTVTICLNILFMLIFVIVFERYGKVFREIMDQVKRGWGVLTVFVLALYGFSYALILYPEPWKNRLEYAPVILCYGLLILFSYLVIVNMVVSMSKIKDMQQRELSMKLKLETQNRELEEKKSRIMIDQVHPHFIYNVLMSIRYFTKKEPDTAYDLIYDFSKYLRSNMESLTENKYISWEEELDHINTYVKIEKMRFKERLNVVFEIGEQDILIPPLTVELLVENAIKHGVSQKIEGGTVWIRGAEKIDEGYQIIVEDNGTGFDVKKLDEEKSVGFNYIQAQLNLIPGSFMEIESTPGAGTKVRIVFSEISGEPENEDNRS